MENEEITISKKELRQLIFWACAGVQKHRGGSYEKVVDTIKKYNTLVRTVENKKIIFGYYLPESKNYYENPK